MSVIDENGPPSPSVVKLEITEEVLEVKIEYTQQVKVEQQPAPVPKTAASAAASSPPLTFALLHSYETVFSVMRDHSYGAERDPSTFCTDITYVRQKCGKECLMTAPQSLAPMMDQ